MAKFAALFVFVLTTWKFANRDLIIIIINAIFYYFCAQNESHFDGVGSNLCGTGGAVFFVGIETKRESVRDAHAIINDNHMMQ